MVERVLTHCETDGRSAEPLLILLRRFATESAREEARLFCDELVAEDIDRADAARRSDRGVSAIVQQRRSQSEACPPSAASPCERELVGTAQRAFAYPTVSAFAGTT